MVDRTKAHKIIFSDGTMGLMIDKIPIEKEGEPKKYGVTIEPTEKLKLKYKIKHTDINKENGTVYKEFLQIDCRSIDMTPGFEAWLFLSNYDGSRSGIIENLDMENIRVIQAQREEIISLTTQVGRLNELLRKAVSDPSHFMAGILGDLDRVKKIVGETHIPEGTELVPIKEEQN